MRLAVSLQQWQRSGLPSSSAMGSSVIYKIVKRVVGELAGGHYYEDWSLNYTESSEYCSYNEETNIKSTTNNDQPE